MNWTDIRGHSEQVEMFRRAIGRSRLSHAYLFLGPDGIGKQRFARMLAKCLMCQRNSDEQLESCNECSSCQQVDAGTHPDLAVVGKLEGKSELTIDVFLGPKERRGKEGLCYDLSLRPMVAHRKIAIINDVDDMNDESANALLKTLEEPPADAILILVASNIDALLPTIRSRCQLVRFSPLSNEHVADLLVELEMVQDRQDAEAIASLSDGSLTTAAQLLDPTLRTIRDALYLQLAAEELNPLTAASAVIEGIEEIGGSTNDQRQNAGWIVRFCIEFYRQTILRLTQGTSTYASTDIDAYCSHYTPGSAADLELIMELLQRCEAAGQHLTWRMAIPLCFEGLFDDLARLTRTRFASQSSR